MSGHAAALPYNVAVESHSSRVTMQELAPICAAIQKGITQDVAPAWHVSAVVQAFPAGQSPPGYWLVTIEDNIDAPGAAGYHDDAHRRPYARVDATAGDVSITVDHEVKEMIADPWGSRTWTFHTTQGELIHVLIEVCDPPEEVKYTIDGIAVSDFVLPAYYRHATKQHIPLTHMNAELLDVGNGLKLAQGGYVSWHDQADHWHQATWFGAGKPSVRTLGKIDTEGGKHSPRSVIDRLTREYRASL